MSGFLLNPFFFVVATSYTTNMDSFFAIPAASGKVRLKIDLPSDASGAMIRYKTSAWASGDTVATGTLVANITDDSVYKDANEWYEVAGLTDGTTYYFKAFPYSGSSYNSTIGSNESYVIAGGLIFEYTMDSITGNTLNDTSSNSNNSTMYSVSSEIGKVLNGITATSGNGIGVINTSLSFSGAQTFSFWFKPNASAFDDIFSFGNNTSNQGYRVCARATYLALVTSGNSDTLTGVTYSVGTWQFITVRINSNLSIDVFSNGSLIGNYSTNLAGAKTGIAIAARYDSGYTNSVNGRAVSIDQFRYYNRALSDTEINNIYNSGTGC